MTFETLNLGYTLRQAKFASDASLEVSTRDLELFKIPDCDAAALATAYREYLVAVGILPSPTSKSEIGTMLADQVGIEALLADSGRQIVAGAFDLDLAISIVWGKANVAFGTAVRWCLMIEYLIWRGQTSYEDKARQAAIDDRVAQERSIDTTIARHGNRRSNRRSRMVDADLDGPPSPTSWRVLP